MNAKKEQQRNIKIILGATLILEAVGVGVAVALYQGNELPPSEMRRYFTLPDGYAPPPSPGVIPANTVARGSLSLRGSTPNTIAGKYDTEPASMGQNVTGAASIPALTSDLARDPATAALGKQRYEENCAMCHGLPGHGIGVVGQEYTPPAPDLAERVPKSSPDKLFTAISSGIRSTPTPETTRYLPHEWHAFAPYLSVKERLAIVIFMQKAFIGSGVTSSLRPAVLAKH